MSTTKTKYTQRSRSDFKSFERIHKQGYEFQEGDRSKFKLLKHSVQDWQASEHTGLIKNTGAAYLFDPATGELLLALNNPEPLPGDGFGFAVSAVGNQALIGSPGKDVGTRNTGTAYIFDSETGVLLLTLNNPSPAANDRFGFAVSAVGSLALIGAPGSGGKARNTGAVYGFDENTGALQLTLHNPEPSSGDGFGFSIAAIADKILVGAPYDDTAARDTGSAYLFDSITGELLLTLRNPDPDAGDQFATSVAAFGDKILISAPKNDVGARDAGTVYVFDSLTGTLLLTIDNPFPNAGDEFGKAIAATSNQIVVGARDDDTRALNSGSVYVFDGETGNLQLTLDNPDADEGDSFGRSVVTVNNEIVVGSRYESTSAMRSGAVYLIESAAGELQQVIDNPSPSPYDLFAHSLGVVNSKLLVGAIGDDVWANSDRTLNPISSAGDSFW